MSWHLLLVLLLMGATFATMLWEKLSLDLVAMLALCALLGFGVLTPEEAFQVFGNDAVITIACLFVLSAALERTGAIEILGRRLNRIGGKSDLAVLLVMLPLVAFVSAFVNNTPVVVVFLPIMISLAARRNLRPSRLLIPLSYASIFGGCCTLIGTSTNLVVSATAVKSGQPPLGMFEFTRVGVLMALAGVAYLMLVGRHLLPQRETLASLLQGGTSKQYLTEAVVVAGSPLIGRPVAETPLPSLPNARILEVVRSSETLAGPVREIVLAQGDRLRLTTVLSSVMEIKGLKGLEIYPHANLGLEPIGLQKALVVESVIGPDSELIGQTIQQAQFGRRYGVLILALHRRGVNVRENLEAVQLRFGDTLLLEGTESAINALRDNRDFLLLADVPHTPPRRARMGVAIAAISLVVALSTLNVMPIAVLAVIAAVGVVLAGCLSAEEAYASIDWSILFLIIGMLSLGVALDRTHGADLLARVFIRGVGWLGPHAVLSATYLVTTVLTEFLSSKVVAVLLTPIAINSALMLHVSPRPFIIAVALGASASFATPIGHQVNTLVYGAGGYQFRDFIKVGAPLNLLFWLLATFLIPLFWPLTVHP
ncbi:MAG: anion permease [Verrucomicrobia bacterium]|nr:anion permease [Verrucomicrobiota bacterium]